MFRQLPLSSVYMTGILPIKKDGSQSAISDFQEYSMLKPRQFAKYVGFTEDEVKRLCHDYGSDFEKMKPRSLAKPFVSTFVSAPPINSATVLLSPSKSRLIYSMRLSAAEVCVQ